MANIQRPFFTLAMNSVEYTKNETKSKKEKKRNEINRKKKKNRATVGRPKTGAMVARLQRSHIILTPAGVK